MGLLGLADPGFVPADVATGFAFGMIKILGFGALAIVAVGFLLSVLCDFCECRKLRQTGGRTAFWRLTHSD
jgi:hypothetical protein